MLVFGLNLVAFSGEQICYENDHPTLLQAVLRNRLAPGGRVFFAYAVRFPGLHEELLDLLRGFCRSVALWHLARC